MEHITNRRTLPFLIVFLLLYFCQCNSKTGAENKDVTKPFRKKLPCVPYNFTYTPSDSFFKKLLKDTSNYHKELNDGYKIEFTSRNSGEKEMIFTDTSLKKELYSIYLLEGFYSENLKTGLWKKYIHVDLNRWVLWEDVFYENGKVKYTKKNVINFDHIFSNEIFGYPSCNAFFIEERSKMYKKLYGKLEIEDSTIVK